MNRQTSSFWSTRGNARNSAVLCAHAADVSECLLSGLYRHTTLEKRENNFQKFGELLEPHYSITQAVADGAVAIVYKGRHVEMTQNQSAVDLWFERHTQGLSKSSRQISKESMPERKC